MIPNHTNFDGHVKANYLSVRLSVGIGLKAVVQLPYIAIN